MALPWLAGIAAIGVLLILAVAPWVGAVWLGVVNAVFVVAVQRRTACSGVEAEGLTAEELLQPREDSGPGAGPALLAALLILGVVMLGVVIPALVPDFPVPEHFALQSISLVGVVLVPVGIHYWGAWREGRRG